MNKSCIHFLALVTMIKKPWRSDEHTANPGQIPAKWLNTDGLQGTMLFAGEYINREPAYYGFITQSFLLILKLSK